MSIDELLEPFGEYASINVQYTRHNWQHKSYADEKKYSCTLGVFVQPGPNGSYGKWEKHVGTGPTRMAAIQSAVEQAQKGERNG